MRRNVVGTHFWCPGPVLLACLLRGYVLQRGPTNLFPGQAFGLLHTNLVRRGAETPRESPVHSDFLAASSFAAFQNSYYVMKTCTLVLSQAALLLAWKGRSQWLYPGHHSNTLLPGSHILLKTAWKLSIATWSNLTLNVVSTFASIFSFISSVALS